MLFIIFLYVGIDEFNVSTLLLEESLLNMFRIDYHYWHIFYLLAAIKWLLFILSFLFNIWKNSLLINLILFYFVDITRDGVNIKGYFAWFDNFKWNNGYTVCDLESTLWITTMTFKKNSLRNDLGIF